VAYCRGLVRRAAPVLPRLNPLPPDTPPNCRAKPIANAWRTTPDIGDLFDTPDRRCPCKGLHCWQVELNIGPNHCSVTNILDKQITITQLSGPGGFGDLDMLEVGHGGMSTEEYRSHFSLWAALKSPLILGTNLLTISQPIFDILSNPEIIAINQDPLGVAASLVHREESGGIFGLYRHILADIWAGPLIGNRVVAGR
jgi:alpha-galactosidase